MHGLMREGCREAALYSTELTAAVMPVKPNGPRTRTTLSVRAGFAVRLAVAIDTRRQGSLDRAPASTSASQNGVVPLKRLTAGRKELKIAHDGATYLLRVTKSNKLILTKAEAAPAAISTT